LYNNGTQLGTTTFVGSTANFNSISVVISGGGSVTLQANVTFSGAAPVGANTFSVQGATGTNGQAVGFSNLPLTGATITISSATATPSQTATVTITTIATMTRTATAIASGTPAPIIFPNPSDGTKPVSVNVPNLAANADITVQIFTTAFRKVQEIPFTNVPAGTVSFNLTDRSGSPLASGLYYVVIHTPNGRSVAKLLLLR
ncbi:MAG TPA: FlgD immunoglobulin-like domain containing protein, partial [bacterium]